MNYSSLRVMCFVVVIIMLTAVSYAEVPGTMSYQGHLVNSEGQPVDDFVTMTFSIYDDSTGGAALWSETHPNVDVDSGAFSVVLGSLNPIPDSAFSPVQCWLEIIVGGEALTPRTRLTSTPYSYASRSVSGDIETSPGHLSITDVGRSGAYLDLNADFSGANLALSPTTIGVGQPMMDFSASSDIARLKFSLSGYDDTCLAIYSSPDGRSRITAFKDGGASRLFELNGVPTEGGSFALYAPEGEYTEDPIIDLKFGDIGGILTLTGPNVSQGNDLAVLDPSSFMLYQDGSAILELMGDGLNIRRFGCGSKGTAMTKYGACAMTVEDSASDTLMVANEDGVFMTKTGAKGTWDAFLTADSLKISAGAGAGYVMTSDASGVGTWQPPTGGSDDDWCEVGDVLYTCSPVGIARQGNILHGDSNHTHINFGVACTTGISYGGYNVKCAAVTGGFGNRANGEYSWVGGGRSNKCDSMGGAVGGGYSNEAMLSYGAIAGGYDNSAGNYAFVGGGQSNTAGGIGSAIGGGNGNETYGYYNSIGGGQSNTTDASYATIAGGYGHYVNAYAASVLGGQSHVVQGWNSVVLGGLSDTVGSSGTFSMLYGTGVYINSSYRVALFNAAHPGKLGINRDDNDSGGIGYPIHVGTNTTNGNGAHLTVYGQWVDGSSKTFKTRFEDIDGRELLAKLDELPIQSWQFKGGTGRHIGPFAEDFAGMFGVGHVNDDGAIEDKYLAASDVAGVALAGVKELLQENRRLEDRLAELESLVQKLLTQER